MDMKRSSFGLRLFIRSLYFIEELHRDYFSLLLKIVINCPTMNLGLLMVMVYGC